MPVQRLLEKQMAEQRMPGLAAAVVRGNAVIYEGYLGFANLEHRVPVIAESVFEIASVTKPFTAQAIMRLAQDGQLKLDDPLSKYIADLPEAWAGVTITHCLRHQSGIPNYTQPDEYWTNSRLEKTHHQILALVRDSAPECQPGDRFAYSNTGYYLLGMAIEAVTGGSYGDYLKQTLFDPLGMASTQCNDYDRIVSHRVQGYTAGDDGRMLNKPYYSVSNTFSAGNLLSNVRDLLLWRASLFDDSVLNEDSRTQWWTPKLSAQGNEAENSMTVGLGWFQLDSPHGKFWGHNGGIVGFASTFLYLPDHDITTVVLCNTMIDAPHELALMAVGEVLDMERKRL